MLFTKVKDIHNPWPPVIPQRNPCAWMFIYNIWKSCTTLFQTLLLCFKPLQTWRHKTTVVFLCLWVLWIRSSERKGLEEIAYLSSVMWLLLGGSKAVTQWWGAGVISRLFYSCIWLLMPAIGRNSAGAIGQKHLNAASLWGSLAFLTAWWLGSQGKHPKRTR